MNFIQHARAIAERTPENEELTATVMTVDPPGGSEKILVVEDEQMLRIILVEALTASGYSVVTATDGVEAVEKYVQERDSIALVLTDVGLPRLSGLNALRQIKALNPEARFIVTSGYLFSDIETIAVTGLFDFLAKPFELHEILFLVRKAIDGHA